jgi:sugar phosphate isomerase/epimerase
MRDHTKLWRLLDTKAMTDEADGRPATIRKHAKHLAHYHANDANLEGPGFGEVDFTPIFQALKDIDYLGYVSVEVFIFDPGPEAIATKSLRYMQQFA